MFEFGRDLRRLFDKARDSEDLGWLEVISPALLENEARNQSIESGRISCALPHHAALRAAFLWREHARRTGAGDSLKRALSEARAAARHALQPEQTIRAAVEMAKCDLLAFDLVGGPERLTSAQNSLSGLPATRRAPLNAALSAIEARISARHAVLDGSRPAMVAACEALETVVKTDRATQGPYDVELRLEQASLSLEIGLLTRDLRRLDQAGRDLRELVEEAPGDQKPLTRGRALALCGVGMLALARLADDAVARAQGDSLIESAFEQFTMDHSPLDWAAIQLMRSDSDHPLPLITLVQVEALTEAHGLIMCAEARERRLSQEIGDNQRNMDLASLHQLENRILSRLRDRDNAANVLEWVTNQIAMARIAMARSQLTGLEPRDVGLMLVEAETTAQELGAMSLAERARALRPKVQTT